MKISDSFSNNTLNASNLAQPKSLISTADYKFSFRLFNAIAHSCLVSVMLFSISFILSKTSSLLVGRRYFLAEKLSHILLILLISTSPDSMMIMNADRGIMSVSVSEGVLKVYRMELPFEALNIILVNLCKSFAWIIPEMLTSFNCEKLALSRSISFYSLLEPLKISLALKSKYL